MWDRVGQSIPHLLGYWDAAARPALRPAADNAGKHPGAAASANDHQPAGTKLVDSLAHERGRPAFGNTLGARDQLLAGDFAQLVKLAVEPRLRPAGVAKRPLVLRADHQERVAGGRQLDVMDCLQ